MPFLHDTFPTLAQTLPHVSLGDGPTPVRPLDSLGFSSEVWVKDESVFGNGGWGGNKVRKLEWIIPDVSRLGKDTMLTVGGIGTHWGLAAALYGHEHGLRTVLAMTDQPVDDHVRDQQRRLKASPAILHYLHTQRRLKLATPVLMARYARKRSLPYYLPAGESSAVGALGYVETALEIATQVAAGDLPKPAYLVSAVGSGGTAAGLALGLRLAGLKTRVIGIVVNDAFPLDAPMIADLATETELLLRDRGAGLPDVDLGPDDVDMRLAWLGKTYGDPTPLALETQALARDKEGLELEPVYTAKALGAIRDLDAQGFFADGPVLFLQTHGPRSDV